MEKSHSKESFCLHLIDPGCNHFEDHLAIISLVKLGFHLIVEVLYQMLFLIEGPVLFSASIQYCLGSKTCTCTYVKDCQQSFIALYFGSEFFPDLKLFPHKGLPHS